LQMTGQDGLTDGYEQLGASRQTVMIDGLCASARTFVLAMIPRNKICVTSNANSPSTRPGTSAHIGSPSRTRKLFAMYPAQVRRWIAHHGGLTPRIIFLRGKQLQAMYHSCWLDAKLSTPC
jgi:hypothetical protein